MPELPEVEICRRNLARWVQGRTVSEVDVRDKGAIRGTWSTRPSQFLPDGHLAVQALAGEVASEPQRHGKRLGWGFGTKGLLIHLGMTGAWRRDDEAPKFTRVGLRFDDRWLWFVDMRRFGCVIPCPADQIAQKLAAGHGPDGLLDPQDGPRLAARMATKKAVKVALLDQNRIAGVGNIHASEALWRSKIHPGRPANSLDAAEWARLADDLVVQLSEAITQQDHEDFQYITEGGENPFVVYRHEGEECPRCNAVIELSTMGGRSTYHCPSCQPA